jgi:hypothetical protein
MKIKNLNKGKDYQLFPDTALQIERTNPFFSEYGEQSLPVDLPDTPLNRELTGHPEDLAGSRRPESGAPVEIIDGEYHVRAQQRVLSAKRNDKISTSYLLAQSELYAIVGDTLLIDVFDDATISGTDSMTLDQKISWLDSLKNHADPNFDVFPVAMNNEGSGPSIGYTLLNARGVIFNHPNGNKYFLPEPVSGSGTYSEILWLNAQSRNITLANYGSVTLQKGYYMTPFVRVMHVLELMLSHFGYTLDDTAVADDVVINNMVFINNTIDSMVTDGGILYSDLVPDCSCSDLLDLFRHKFNMEFVCDASTMTVIMLPFNVMLGSDPVDITPYHTGHPDIEYQESYRRLVLAPSGTTGGDVAPPVRETTKKHLASKWNAVFGGWVAEGHQGNETLFDPVVDGTTGYNLGEEEDIDAEEIKSPDTIPSMVSLNDWSGEGPNRKWTYPLIGDERALYSRLSSDVEDSSVIPERPKLDMMLMLPYNDYKSFPRGTLINYDYYRYYNTRVDVVKIKPTADYSLCYHGNDGLFERYWRYRDELLRNAMNRVRASLLLPDSIKMSLSPLSRVLLHGSPLLIDTLSIILGQDDALQESVLLSTTIQDPASHAPAADEIVSPGYHWQLKCILSSSTQYAYNNASDEERNPPKVFPKVPASAVSVGDECCLQTQYVELTPTGAVLWRDGIDEWPGTMPYDIAPNGRGYLVNVSYPEHNVYIKIQSKMVCVANNSE